METENTNQRFKDYVKSALRSDIKQESIVNTLLAKGWLLSEISSELSIIRNTVVDDGVANEGGNRRTLFAIASVVLFTLAVVAWFINPLFSLLFSFSGFVVGIIGVRSKKKIYAVFGIILNSLTLVVIVFLVGSFVYMTKTGKNLLTGDTLSEQDKINLRINETVNSN